VSDKRPQMNIRPSIFSCFGKKNALLHFSLGVFPFFLLFVTGVYYLQFYQKNDILKNIPSNHPLAYFSLSFLIILAFSYLIFLSLRMLRSNLKKEFIAISAMLALCSPVLFLGPFFQPPSDPIFHAGLMWDFTELNYFDTVNRALVTKSLFACFRFFIVSVDWESRLQLVLFFHMFTIGCLLLSSYFSARLTGLNFKWAIFSTLTLVLFFGTSQFGFLSYYSLAPASINIAFYWLVAALIFRSILMYHINEPLFSSGFFYICILGIFLLPILFYNHRQEAGFLAFIFLLAFIILVFKILSKRNIGILNTQKFTAAILLILFFPNSFLVNSKIPFLSIGNIAEYEASISGLSSPWVIGNIFGPRVFDTLGVIGLVPLVFCFGYFIYNRIFLRTFSNRENSFYVTMIPGLLPFWIIFIPFNMLVWLKGTKTSEVFWRFCYLTQFWISIAWIGYKLEGKINPKIKKFWNKVLP